MRFSSVSFRYSRRGPWILEELSASFARGTTVLLGANGAGKSTLLALAASALAPTSGVVRIGDVAAAGSTLTQYRRLVGWMPQAITPFARFSVRECVAYSAWLNGAARTVAWDDAMSALRRVSLGSDADKRASTLSGGQLRRLGIAQVLVHGAQWLLLDEPTAGLDPIQRASFRGLLGELSAEVNVVVSTHETGDIATVFDAVALMADGALIWNGSPHDFTADVPQSVPEAERAEYAFAQRLSKGGVQ